MSSANVSTKCKRIAEMAARGKDWVLTTLFHLIDEEWLREAYNLTRKDGATGVDKVSGKEYGSHRDANLQDLLARMKSKCYRAPSVRRVQIPKGDGGERALGIPTFEDKVLQRAVTMLLEPVYEQDFYPCSYGFRPKRSAHGAVRELRDRCMFEPINWILDADIKAYFDTIDHAKLVEIIRQRVNDGDIIRYIGKWLNAGVLEEGRTEYPERGTPQGGVISPLLANIYLHTVLDKWFYEEVQPRLKGRSFLIRYADDFVIGFELEEDARRVYEVLPKRFDKYGLTIHPEKTKLRRFARPRQDHNDKDDDNETVDFLGFTHYWAKSLKGNWVIKRKTARKRLCRSMKAVDRWCKANRHEPLVNQWAKLKAKLSGWYQYYAVICNSPALDALHFCVLRRWRFWLNRRGGNRPLTVERFKVLLQYYPLPTPRIIHDF